MITKRTVKCHGPQQGLYVYARTEEGRTELIVLNSTDNEQILMNKILLFRLASQLS